MDSKYIVIEGPDRSGKDTQAKLLARHLVETTGHAPLVVSEPCTDLPTGKLLRQLLKSGEYPEAHAALFMADRAALQKNIISPALNSDRTVISVRSFMSTLVYQQDLWPLDSLYEIQKNMILEKPTHLIVLDIDPEVAQKRMETDQGRSECYEVLETQKRVRLRYLNMLLDPKFWDIWQSPAQSIILQGGAPKESVHDQIIKFLGV